MTQCDTEWVSEIGIQMAQCSYSVCWKWRGTAMWQSVTTIPIRIHTISATKPQPASVLTFLFSMQSVTRAGGADFHICRLYVLCVGMNSDRERRGFLSIQERLRSFFASLLQWDMRMKTKPTTTFDIRYSRKVHGQSIRSSLRCSPTVKDGAIIQILLPVKCHRWRRKRMWRAIKEFFIGRLTSRLWLKWDPKYSN